MIIANMSTKKIIKHHKAFYFTTFYFIIDMDIGIVYLTFRTLSYDDGASHRLDKQSLQDAPVYRFAKKTK